MSIKVVKRDGRIVDFNQEKIKNAIIKAMSETKSGVDEELAELISIDIFTKINTNISVEEIQDIVENKLMESNRKDVAKTYIIYRHERNKKRNIKDTKFKLLDDEFISKYKHKPNPMDQLGSFVYYRTYSRWLDKENRRENWWETVRRAVEYNCNLVNTTKQEAQELYDNIFNLKQYLSGRTFWVGGTKVAADFPTGNFNCFRRNTEFLTKYGLKSFEDFNDGDIVEVLDKNGGWVPSLVRNYGKDQLYRLIIRRGSKHHEEIYTTKNHLWFIKRKNTYDKYIKQETNELKAGDILKYVRRYNCANLNIDPMAIMHGIVYGDGSYNTTKNFCQVRLCGDKISLLKYFKGYSNCKIKNTEDIFVYGIPYNFKQLPSLNSNPEYIKGFLLGIMLTDGTIKKSIKISQSDYKSLKYIQSLFEIIGITSDEIIEYHRVNNNFNSENEYYYTLTLHKKAFYWHFSEFNKSDKVNDIEWTIVSVEKTNIVEDVWCVEVPSTQSFTLRGGIHTHNCCFNIIDTFQAFKDIFYLCLVGAGVGFRILKSDVEKLPKVRTNLKIYHEEYRPKPKSQRKDNTSLIYLDNDTVTLEIGDSKAGWVQGLDFYFKLITDSDYKNIKNVLINYDMVRPKGEPLKTFGGTASGHESIKTMFVKINRVIQNYAVITERIKLQPIDCLDIATIIGENVVVGGVRRCLPEGTLVHTKQGLIPIEKIKVGMEAKTSNGYSPITDWVNQGTQRLLTIKTQMGEFRCTPKHKMAIMTSVGKYEWIMAKDLRQGDRLIFVNNGIEGFETQLPEYIRDKKDGDTNSIDIDIPTLTKEIAWFFGYFHGNGCVQYKEISIVVPYGLEPFIDKIVNIINSFGVNAKVNDTQNEHCYKIRCSSVQLAEYLGQWKITNSIIKVPEFILEGTMDIRKSYLLGLYEADGSTKNRPIIAVTSVYHSFIKEIQVLYASIGIATRLKLHRPQIKKWKSLYTLSVVGVKEKEKFINTIGNFSIKFEDATKNIKGQNDYGYPSFWFKNNYKSWTRMNRQMTVSQYENIFNESQNLIPVEVLELNYDDKKLYQTYDISVNEANEFVCDMGLLVHNTALIGLIDWDDKDAVEAKENLYILQDDQWKPNTSILHRSMSNNSIFYEKKPTREQLHWQMEKMRYSGEPGWVNAEAARKRRKNMNGVNPCFRGDMKLLTVDGYKTFEELCDKEVEIINKDGDISLSKIWCSGEKEIYEIRFTNRSSIFCTSNHVFKDIEDKKVPAINLKNHRIMPYLNHEYEGFNDRFIEYGFLQGDGTLGRLDSDTHKGLEINIGKNDDDIRTYFNLNDKEGRSIYINGYNEELKELGFSSKPLPERTLPSSINTWNKHKLRSFLKGLYSANGSVLSNGRIQFKSTCKELIEGIQEILLKSFNIDTYFTTNKPKKNKFSNGIYQMKESYDLCIQQYESRKTFYNEIGFLQDYKMKKLKDSLIDDSPLVINIIKHGIEKVYDFNEPITHWGVVEGVIAHNCGEILLDNRGMCNLVTVNVMGFVKDNVLDLNSLLRSQRLSARAAFRMTQIELELHDWNEVQQRDHIVGCSLTGWQDLVNALHYNKDDERNLLSLLRKEARDAVNSYCDELGIKDYPDAVTTIKPEGTLSQLSGVSSGIHYSHSPYFIRRIRINSHDPLVKVAEELGWTINCEVGQNGDSCTTKVIDFYCKAPEGKTKYDVSAIEQLENYKLFMEEYVDHNASITVHVRDNEWDDVEEWVWNNWDNQVALSFLSLDDSFYQLMPYEAITEEEYNEKLKNMNLFVPSLLQKYESHDEHEVDNSDCSSGICPIR